MKIENLSNNQINEYFNSLTLEEKEFFLDKAEEDTVLDISNDNLFDLMIKTRNKKIFLLCMNYIYIPYLEKIAKDPNTDKEIILKLTLHQASIIIIAILKRDDTNSDILIQILKNIQDTKIHPLRYSIINHPKMDEETLYKLSFSDNNQVLSNVLLSNKVSIRIIQKLQNSKDEEIRTMALVRDPNADMEFVYKTIKKEIKNAIYVNDDFATIKQRKVVLTTDILEAALKNPNLCSEYLKEYRKCPAILIKTLVLSHPNIPKEEIEYYVKNGTEDVKRESLIKIEEITNPTEKSRDPIWNIIRNCPKTIDEITIARYVYLELGKLYSFDLSYGYGKSDEKENIYKKSNVAEINYDRTADYQKVICVDIAKTYSYILNKFFNIKCTVARDSVEDPHVHNIIYTRNKRIYNVDLQLDLFNIQTGQRPKNFAYDSIGYNTINKDSFRSIDKKLGYISKNCDYTDEYFYMLKKAVSMDIDLEQKMDMILPSAKMYKNINNVNYIERILFYNDLIKKVLTEKEFKTRDNHATLVRIVNGEKEYLSCFSILAKYKDKPSKYIRYIYSEDIKGYKKISEEELLSIIHNEGWKPALNETVLGMKKREFNFNNKTENQQK